MPEKPDKKPVANIPPFGLRMQPELKAKVEDAAATAGRSLNAEIVARLEKSFEIERETQAISGKIAQHADELVELKRMMAGLQASLDRNGRLLAAVEKGQREE